MSIQNRSGSDEPLRTGRRAKQEIERKPLWQMLHPLNPSRLVDVEMVAARIAIEFLAPLTHVVGQYFNHDYRMPAMQVILDGLQDLRLVALDIDLDHICALKALLFDYVLQGVGSDD